MKCVECCSGRPHRRRIVPLVVVVVVVGGLLNIAVIVDKYPFVCSVDFLSSGVFWWLSSSSSAAAMAAGGSLRALTNTIAYLQPDSSALILSSFLFFVFGFVF